MSGEVTHYHAVFFDAFLAGDDFHICNCTAETFAIEYVVYLGWFITWAVCHQVCVSVHAPGVGDHWLWQIPYNSSPLVLRVPKPCPPWASLNALASAPMCPFQSPTWIRISVAGTLATPYCSSSAKRYFSGSGWPTWIVYAKRKAKTALQMISLRMTLSQMCWTSNTFFVKFSAYFVPAYAHKKNLNWQSLSIRVQTWLGLREPIYLCSRTSQI